MTPAEARRTLGLSVTQMAGVVRVAPDHWRRIERGAREPGGAMTALLDLLLWCEERGHDWRACLRVPARASIGRPPRQAAL